MIAGTAYGTILNDRAERAALAEAFTRPPYASPPHAPVLYIKPHNTFAGDGASVVLPHELARVTVAATLALVFNEAGRPIGARLALDLSEPHTNYFRPAIRERCRDGFLPLGSPGVMPGGTETIVTSINGREAHRWSLDRLHRPIDTLVSDIAAFMSFQPGDILLIGLPGDAPEAMAGDRIEVRCADYPSLSAVLVAEAA